MSCQLNFLTIPSLLEIDSEAAPSCFCLYIVVSMWTGHWAWQLLYFDNGFVRTGTDNLLGYDQNYWINFESLMTVISWNLIPLRGWSKVLLVLKHFPYPNFGLWSGLLMTVQWGRWDVQQLLYSGTGVYCTIWLSSVGDHSPNCLHWTYNNLEVDILYFQNIVNGITVFKKTKKIEIVLMPASICCLVMRENNKWMWSSHMVM